MHACTCACTCTMYIMCRCHYFDTVYIVTLEVFELLQYQCTCTCISGWWGIKINDELLFMSQCMCSSFVLHAAG